MNHDNDAKGFWNTRYAIGLLVLGAVATYFLLSEQRAQLFGALPFLLLLACPLMHIFIHHGHGGQGSSKTDRDAGEPGANASAVGLQTRFPSINLLSHNTRHLWSTLLGAKGDPPFGPLHIASYAFLGLGFYLLSSAWSVLYQAQRGPKLASTWAYARVPLPHYVPFALILLGFLLQWPTLLTLAMFPILLVMYGRLARAEEAQMRAQFGEEFERYIQCTPGFFPRMALGSTAA